MIDIRLWGYGLEDISITKASQIKSVEFSISIKDQNYKEIDEATVIPTVPSTMALSFWERTLQGTMTVLAGPCSGR